MAIRITAKQKSARRKNIKIAQSARKKAGAGVKKGYQKYRGKGHSKKLSAKLAKMDFQHKMYNKKRR